MFASYFAYYPLIIFVSTYFYIRDIKLFNKVIFVIIFSFIIYYLIFIFFPAGGPQFYFNLVDIEIPVHGFFGKTMRLIQRMGERPAGAFPSSHVGIAVIIVIYIWKYIKKFFPYILILVVLLFLSTIYIRAHYLIDSIAGLLTAPLLYLLGKRFYYWLNISREAV